MVAVTYCTYWEIENSLFGKRKRKRWKYRLNSVNVYSRTCDFLLTQESVHSMSYSPFAISMHCVGPNQTDATIASVHTAYIMGLIVRGNPRYQQR